MAINASPPTPSPVGEGAFIPFQFSIYLPGMPAVLLYRNPASTNQVSIKKEAVFTASFFLHHFIIIILTPGRIYPLQGNIVIKCLVRHQVIVRLTSADDSDHLLGHRRIVRVGRRVGVSPSRSRQADR
jgi:hypothetical protein